MVLRCAEGKVATETVPSKPPGPLTSIGTILYRLHTAEPLKVEHEVPQTLLEDLTARLKFSLHVSQRIARILGTLLVRAVVKHPLGWTIPQEVICMLMYGILQSRQVPAWRAFFSGVTDLSAWCPVIKEKVNTGSCESWWIRLALEARPQQPQAAINWLFLHGGAFVAGDALMYVGTFMYWLKYLAKQGIDCSILSVEYPLAPEHPFPAGLNAAADAIHWLLHDSGETADYFVGGDSAGGNLAVTALSLLRDGGKLSRPPLGLTLISPAVDLSNASVFGSQEPVSSHFEQQQQQQHLHGQGQQHSHSHSCGRSHDDEKGKHSSSNKGREGADGQAPNKQCVEQNLTPGQGASTVGSAGGKPGATAATEQQRVKPSPGIAQLLLAGSFRRRTTQQQQQQQQAPLETQGSINVAQRQLQQQEVLLQSQPSIDCKMHSAHTAGGKLRPWHLFKGVLGDFKTALRVHNSGSSAREVAAGGWFDYIPADSFADELHCYLADPKLLSHPLVSPTYLKDFTGLCQAGMLVVAGGAELMRRDIATFAAKAAAAGATDTVAQAPAAPQESPAAAAAGKLDPVAQAPAAPEASAAAALRESDETDGDNAGQAAGTSAVQSTSLPAASTVANGSSSIGGSSSGSSFKVVYHEEPCEPHVYPMLSLPHLLKKGLVVPRFVAAVVQGESLEKVGRASSADSAA